MPIEAEVTIPVAPEKRRTELEQRRKEIQRAKTVTPAPVTMPAPINTQPAKAPSSDSAPYQPSPNLKYGVTRPPALMYRAELGQKWRPTREFYLEKLEEMRKKRLAKMPEEKPVIPAIPPTIKFGAYEVKTEHVAIGALALIIIAVVIFT